MVISTNRMYFSQCNEDEYLNEHYFHNKRDGTYIELGALDGVLYSNTKFYQDQLGWKGVLIEPHRYAFSLLQKNRPDNYLFNDLVSCIPDELKYKYFLYGHAAVSGVENTLTQFHFDEFYNNPENEHLQQDTMMIRPKTLTEILNDTPIRHFDLLSLDVEGHEYEVLKSWDFSIPIDVILIEMLGKEPAKEDLCRKLLIDNCYKLDSKYEHNEIFTSVVNFDS